MFNRQLKQNIKTIDNKISELTEGLTCDLTDDEYNVILDKIKQLTEIRSKLIDKSNGGNLTETLASGAITLAGILIVLKYEETDIITSKAFNMATKMFRG